MTHYVYRLYDANDTLLYVGFTVDLQARLTFHRRPWYNNQAASWDVHDAIASWTVESFEDEWAARAREREAIAAESPLFNRWRPVESGLPMGPIASRWRPAPSGDFRSQLEAALAPRASA